MHKISARARCKHMEDIAGKGHLFFRFAHFRRSMFHTCMSVSQSVGFFTFKRVQLCFYTTRLSWNIKLILVLKLSQNTRLSWFFGTFFIDISSTKAFLNFTMALVCLVVLSYKPLSYKKCVVVLAAIWQGKMIWLYEGII